MGGMRFLLAAAAGLSIAAALAAPAAAQSDYPNRPIRMIIPFPAGGSNDIVGRAIATQMSERLGKQIVIDNRSGAGGVVGTEAASKTPNDGYTILVIEHDMHVVEGISDRVVALDHGVKIAEGSFDAVATDPKVVEAYLGTTGMARK